MKIFFSGVGGIGMSALAQIAALNGHEVVGSDIKPSYITEKLQQMGIQIFFKQEEKNITEDIDLFVYSSAIDKENPEYKKANLLNIKSLHRSQYLDQILLEKELIAITGSSGKTTTTTLTGLALNQMGIKSNLITGGWIKELNSNVIWNDSNMVVIEADESDGSLLNYHPNIALITDLAVDVNLNSGEFKNVPLQDLKSKLKEIYKKFVERIIDKKGRIIISNDEELFNFIKNNGFIVNVVFGEKTYVDYGVPFIYFDNLIQYEKGGFPFVEFTLGLRLKNDDLYLGNANLKSIGRYNAFNFVGACSTLFSLTENVDCLKKLCSISPQLSFTKRRFEILFNDIVNGNRLVIVDDYAHNPKKISFLIENVNFVYKDYQRIAIFQPHRYTRTMMFWDKLKNSFFNLDYLIILPIYSAGEKPIENINSENLTEMIKKQNTRIKQILYIDDFDRVIRFLRNVVGNKDSIVIFIGAGNITNLANNFASSFYNFVKKF